MKESTVNSAVPAVILRKLQLVRKRKLAVQVASALVAAAAVLLAAMGIAMLIDWLATLYDSRWRVVLTASATAAAALTSIGWILVAWRRALRLERVAAEIDQQVPRLEERWTTMTRLGEDAAKPEVIHPAMLRRLSKESVSWEPHVEPENVVSFSVLVRAMVGLTAITAVLALAVVLNPREMTVLARRFWAPNSSISATTIVDVPGNLVIARGEALALTANIGGQPVETATLFLQPQEKPTETISLVAERSAPIGFKHRIRSVEEPFAYRFRAGDGQTEWYDIEVADRPEIDAIKLTITPPAYTRQTPKTFDKLPERVSAMRNSRIDFAVRTKSPVQTAELKMDNGKHVSVPLNPDGWYRWSEPLTDSFSLTPVLTEPHGLSNRRQPKCLFIVYDDQPPVVKVLSPNDQMAIRPDDDLQITFSATDDVGIGSAELVVYRENGGPEATQLAVMPIDLGNQQGSRNVQKTVDLDLKKFATRDGSELSYEIRVREDRGTEPTRIASRQPTGDKSPKQPQRTATAAGSPSKSSLAAANSANQAPSSAAPNSPSTTGSPTSAKSDQANAQASPQATSAKPSTNAMASNDDARAKSATSVAQPQSAENDQAAPLSNAASPSSQDANNKLATASQPPTPNDQQNKRSGETDATRTAPGGQQAMSASEKPSGAQSASTPQSSRSPNSNSNVAKNSPAANQQPPKSQSTADRAAQMSKSETPPNPTSPAKHPAEPPVARTATSGRQSLMANRDANMLQQPPSMQPDHSSPNSYTSDAKSGSNTKQEQPGSTSQTAKNESKSEKSATASGQQSPNANQTATNKSPHSRSSPSTPPPGDNMNRRSLDVPQTASSQRMRLKVDQWAGSFAGQQRAKLEMSIAPQLAALDEKLAKAQRTARGVLDGLEADPNWLAPYDRDIADAQQLVMDGKAVIDKLFDESKDTPYAFVGLQVADLGVAHLDPARNSFWNAIQSKGDDRTGSVRDGWQHLGRARQLLADLRGQFERSRREFQLAEAIERAKKMYRVYVENTHALLDVHDDDPNRYQRKMAEFSLDDEYLKRLKEVLKMRTDLEKELARILAEDPRLLRRYMDLIRARSHNLREQLADQSANQERLNREVRAWSAVAEADRPQMAQLLLLEQVQDAAKIATAAGELQDRYQSWLPLDHESKDASLAVVSKKIQQVATDAGELNSRAAKYIASAQQPPATPATPAPAGAAANVPNAFPAPQSASQPTPAPGQALDQMIGQGESLYGQLTQLEVALRQLASRKDQPEVALFAANRLVETRQLIADTSAWVRQVRAHKAGSYTGAAEVTQYRLAMKTDELAGKLSDLEQTLSAMLQRTDGQLPEPIAAKSRELLATLDKEASPSQLAAVYALHGNQLPHAIERQQTAQAALTKSEKLYDELMRLAITEMDKLPVQDPIASLLDDPTLDELLAQLENEPSMLELLGIHARPTNLQIIGDWIRPGSGGGGGGGMQILAMNQMQQHNRRTQQKLNQAYQRAVARALKETKPKRIATITKNAKLSDWNRLVSHLADDLGQGRDKAPPEQYRQAIEQYFTLISQAVADQEKQAP